MYIHVCFYISEYIFLQNGRQGCAKYTTIFIPTTIGFIYTFILKSACIHFHASLFRMDARGVQYTLLYGLFLTCTDTP